MVLLHIRRITFVIKLQLIDQTCDDKYFSLYKQVHQSLSMEKNLKILKSVKLMTVTRPTPINNFWTKIVTRQNHYR